MSSQAIDLGSSIAGRRISPARCRGSSIRNATIMVPKDLERSMPTTLTLKNIPDEVYLRLKASAESHRRSLNSEAIVCLESVLLPGRASAEEVIARARAIRESLPKGKLTAKAIDDFKRVGRP
jgi:plasmid stability protein